MSNGTPLTSFTNGAESCRSRKIVFDAERIGPWVCERTGGAYFADTNAAIGLEKDGQLIAGVLYDQYNGNSIAMHVAGEGNWLNRQFLWVCFAYPFIQLKVKKLIGLVDSTNAQALRFDAHLGFVEEARISGAGKIGDLVILTMDRQQCRWI